MRLIVLGSGTSFGIPQIGCACRVCVSADPRDRRSRVAAVVEGDSGTRVLIDTPPELRLQLVLAGVNAVDAVFYTHDHADHIHGIDDLRAISVRHGTLPVYGPPETLERLASRFEYIFDAAVVPPEGTSKPELMRAPLEPGDAAQVGELTVVPVPVSHGDVRVYGYRIGDLGYVTDVKTVPAGSRRILTGVRVLVVGALFERPHPTHFSIDEAVEFSREIGAERTYLTHLTHRFTHAELAARLPAGVEPAYDGLVVTF